MTKKANNFLDYIKETFYDKIHTSVLYKMRSLKSSLVDYFDDAKFIRDIEIDDIDFKTIYIDAKDEDKIEFDIIIVPTIICEYYSFKYREDVTDDISDKWFEVTCTANLSRKLQNLFVVGVDYYNKSRPKKPLSGNLVPIIYHNQYDDYATEILAKYYPEALKEPQRVEPLLLAKRMGLNVITRSITADNSIFGQIFFDDVDTSFYDQGIEAYISEHVKANTIVVDDDTSFLYSFGSKSLTIAHECVHAYLHRRTFVFAKIMNEDLQYIQCATEGGLIKNDNNEVTNFMEIQANGIAPHILMPEKMVRRKLDSLIQSYSIVDNDTLTFIESLIKEIAEFFGVSTYSARKRLIDLGYVYAAGAFNWVDEHYVRPYAYNGKLAYNETFTISTEDLSEIILNNPQFLPFILEGKLVFVENHLCNNHPAFITYDEDGECILTEYARRNMDKACVKFTCNLKNTSSEGSGTFCYLCRDTCKDFKYILQMSLPPASLTNTDEIMTKAAEEQDRQNELYKSLMQIDTLSEAIEFLMEYFSMDKLELCEASDLSEKTIERYLKNKNNVPNKKTIMALIIGFQLPPMASDRFLKIAGISLTRSKEDNMYTLIMATMFNQKIYYINAKLINQGFESLTKEKL